MTGPMAASSFLTGMTMVRSVLATGCEGFVM